MARWLATLSVLSGGFGEPQEPDLDGPGILRRTADVYAKCRSYRDSGVVTTTLIKAGGKSEHPMPFRTAFVRPDRLRYEFEYTDDRSQKKRYLVWGDGKDVRSWWDATPGIRRPASLGLGLAGATGVSGGSAHTIPVLLLPEAVGGRKITDMANPVRLEDAKDCLRVRGLYADRPLTVWLDKTSFLVRRLESEHKFETFRSETVTTYDPFVNGDIPADALKFDPPAEK